MNNKLKYIFIGILIGFILTCLLRPNFTYSDSDNQNFKEFAIKKILRAVHRWAGASLQDLSPIVSVLHANYACGQWWALRDIATDSEIEKISGINLLETEKQLTGMQDLATKKVVENCPQYLKHINKFFVEVAGQGSNSQ